MFCCVVSTRLPSGRCADGLMISSDFVPVNNNHHLSPQPLHVQLADTTVVFRICLVSIDICLARTTITVIYWSLTAIRRQVIVRDCQETGSSYGLYVLEYPHLSVALSHQLLRAFLLIFSQFASLLILSHVYACT
jgi:hypothetical protein